MSPNQRYTPTARDTGCRRLGRDSRAVDRSRVVKIGRGRIRGRRGQRQHAPIDLAARQSRGPASLCRPGDGAFSVACAVGRRAGTGCRR